MKIRLIQKDINNHDYKKFLDDAVAHTPDIVCLPELATSGCLYKGGHGMDIEDIVGIISSYSFAVVIGIAREDKGRLYNSCLYCRGNKYQIYDKINLFAPMHETSVYTPGTAPGLINTEFGKAGLAICYDIRFADVFKSLADGGAKIIFVPAAFRRVTINDWRELIAQRATETGAYVIGINAVGRDSVWEFGGSSMVAGPNGKVLAQADQTTELALDVEIMVSVGRDPRDPAI